MIKVLLKIYLFLLKYKLFNKLTYIFKKTILKYIKILKVNQEDFCKKYKIIGNLP